MKTTMKSLKITWCTRNIPIGYGLKLWLEFSLGWKPSTFSYISPSQIFKIVLRIYMESLVNIWRGAQKIQNCLWEGRPLVVYASPVGECSRNPSVSVYQLALLWEVAFSSHTFFQFIYLFTFRGEGGRKRGRQTSMCGCLLCAPYWGPGP